MTRLVAVVIVFAIILILYMGPGSSPKQPKPATQHASQPTVITPGSNFGDGLKQTIDQKFTLGMEFRFEAQLANLRLALVDLSNTNSVTSALRQQKQLVKDLDEARGSLAAGGWTGPQIDAWLAKTAWPECSHLADQLRAQVAQAPAEGTPDK